MSKTPSATGDMQQVYAMLQDLRPLLNYEEFTIGETDLQLVEGDHQQYHGAVQQAVRAGAIKKAGKEYYGTDADEGDWCWRYEWAQGVREHLRAYIEEMDTLPCGCPPHIPDTRDDPPGVMSCKHCGEEYDAERFKTLVEGKL